VASVLNAPVDTVVFVSNATVAVNTVLKNLVWNPDGRDEILYFSTIYSGCAKTIDCVVDFNPGLVSPREIPLEYPLEDSEILSRFQSAVQASRASGNHPRIVLFDVVGSLPAVRFPFEAMTSLCRNLGILSLIDGAQGVGLVSLDLQSLDPDFFLSNCHKWLHAPRGCAVFYVPVRNQPLIRSSLATSHGYVGRTPRFNPFPPSTKSRFVKMFEFIGTMDNAPYLAVKDAIEWRRSIGGEDRIIAWQTDLAKRGGRRVAEILGTEVLDNESGTLTNCGMVNVALPVVLDVEQGQWLLQTLMSDYHTFVAVFQHRGRSWARLSAQVYLDMDDFEWAGRTLGEVCQRVA
jgi:selenocysteine lyase/cysteine desulfurase